MAAALSIELVEVGHQPDEGRDRRDEEEGAQGKRHGRVLRIGLRYRLAATRAQSFGPRSLLPRKALTPDRRDRHRRNAGL
jgi:hypothetical protein